MLVSCVMPTHRGAAVARVAIESFLEQTWTEAELIVLDNSADGSTEALCDGAGVRYVRVPRRAVGELRNMGAEMARGEVICNWDDDDFYAPERVARQVFRLLISKKQVTGWHSVLYFVPGHGGEFFRFRPSPRRPPTPYAMGTSQCYRREWWRAHPFPRIWSGEDGAFSDMAALRHELDSCDAGALCVARQLEPDAPLRCLLGRHEQWPAAAREEFPREFFEHVDEARAAMAAKEN